MKSIACTRMFLYLFFSFRENKEKIIFTLLSSQHNYSIKCCSKYRESMQTDELVIENLHIHQL